MTGRGTNTYVLGRANRVVVIDPGPADSDHLASIAAAVAARGQAALVLLTHHHLDHSEAAVEVAHRLGAPLAGIPHPDGPPLDRALVDAEQLHLGDVTLEVLGTPGHTRDHACFLWTEEAAVFAGDLVAGEGFIVVDPPDGNMADYLASLARVRDLATGPGREWAVLLPGHGPQIDHARVRLDGYIAHRRQREEQVMSSIPTHGGLSAEQLLPLAYQDTAELMYPVAIRSLQAHLDKLVADGMVIEQNGEYRRPG